MHPPVPEDETAPRPLITVESRKYDGRVHRHWTARVTERSGPLIVLDGRFEEEVRHPLLGHIVRGTRSREYYWTNRWYSIFRFRQPSGELRNYYCNINAPAAFDGRLLSFVDLDIDILVAPDFSFRILDEDEFASNAALLNYPPEFYRRAGEARDELIALIRGREFPFDPASAERGEV
jgi:protein associated with RNAse G/E